jgi:hypothetical protein
MRETRSIAAEAPLTCPELRRRAMFVRSPNLPRIALSAGSLKLNYTVSVRRQDLGTLAARLARLWDAAFRRRLVPGDWAKRLQFDVEVGPNL